MKQYDMACPECGTINRGLYLDETNGWMVCEHCRAEVREDDYKEQGILSFPNAMDHQSKDSAASAGLPMATGWT